MFERFDKDARRAILAASEEASRFDAPRTGTEHVLLGLVSVGVEVDLGVTAADLRTFLGELDVRALQAVGVEVDHPARRGLSRPGRRWSLLGRSHLPFTAAAKESLVRALRIAIDESHRRITPNHILAALATGSGNDPAVRLLKTADIDPAWLDMSIRRGWRVAS